MTAPLIRALALVTNATPAHSPNEIVTIGPLTLSWAHWQIVFRLGATVLTIVIAIVLVRLIPLLERLVIRFARKNDSAKSATASTVERQQRLETLTRVTSSLAQAVIWTTTVILVLGNLGIAIEPLLATAGIAGVAIGFGAQSIVKDFFAGFFILLEDQFDVGDTVTIGGVTGTVERMTMRITVLRDVNGTAYFFPNSTVGSVANRTFGWGRALVDVPFASSVSETDARAVLEKAASRASEALQREGGMADTKVEIEGPTEFAAGTVTWRLVAKTRPDRTADARREMISALSESLRGATLGSNGSAIAKVAAN